MDRTVTERGEVRDARQFLHDDILDGLRQCSIVELTIHHRSAEAAAHEQVMAPGGVSGTEMDRVETVVLAALLHREVADAEIAVRGVDVAPTEVSIHGPAIGGIGEPAFENVQGGRQETGDRRLEMYRFLCPQEPGAPLSRETDVRIVDAHAPLGQALRIRAIERDVAIDIVVIVEA